MVHHPYAFRRYADIFLAGKGTTGDVEAAFRFFKMSAKGGNAVGMFAMGQKAAMAGDKLMAAWFGMAYVRSMDMAGEWLSGLAK